MSESRCPQPAPSDAMVWSERQFGSGRLFQVVPDAVIVGEASSGRIVLWNPPAAAMFGYEEDEGPGLLIELLVPSGMREAHRDGLGRLAAGQPTPLLDSESATELPAVRKDGTQIWIELRLAHVSGPSSGLFALAVIRDITLRREAETARELALREVNRLRDELERRNGELDLVARTDHLTGLWSRRHVEEQLLVAISSARRHRRPVSLLLLDVDEFKLVNDRHGHQAGDRVLAEIATRLRASMRIEDTLGRWGGEEFLVVLPDTEESAALVVGERMRHAIGDDLLRLADTTTLAVTVSVGVTGSKSPDRDALLRSADAALYRAKRAGRNRCSI